MRPAYDDSGAVPVVDYPILLKPTCGRWSSTFPSPESQWRRWNRCPWPLSRRQPIVVGRDGVIIFGHTRWKATKKAAMFQQLKTEGREGIVFKAHRASYEPGRPNIGEKRVRHFYKNADVLESVGDLPRAVMGIVEGVMGKRAKTKAYAEVRRMD